LKAKYRNRTEIIASVLEAAKGTGASKTKIMFTAYLSYEQLKEYLNKAEQRTLSIIPTLHEYSRVVTGALRAIE
jgi:predicted transcriptional regulator